MSQCVTAKCLLERAVRTGIDLVLNQGRTTNVELRLRKNYLILHNEIDGPMSL